MTCTARAAIIACVVVLACSADSDSVSLLQTHVVIDEDNAKLDTMQPQQPQQKKSQPQNCESFCAEEIADLIESNEFKGPSDEICDPREGVCDGCAECLPAPIPDPTPFPKPSPPSSQQCSMGTCSIWGDPRILDFKHFKARSGKHARADLGNGRQMPFPQDGLVSLVRNDAIEIEANLVKDETSGWVSIQALTIKGPSIQALTIKDTTAACEDFCAEEIANLIKSNEFKGPSDEICDPREGVCDGCAECLPTGQLVIRPTTQQSTWNGVVVSPDPRNKYQSATFRMFWNPDSTKAKDGTPGKALEITLPGGVQVVVNQWETILEVEINMCVSEVHGLQNGECGSFSSSSL